MKEITVSLPTFHPDQVRAYHKWRANRFMALRAGRRWGKTDFGKIIACDDVINSRLVGWFAPDYKTSSESYDAILDALYPVKKTSSKTAGMIKSITGGSIEFWTLDNERAGRSRKYHTIIIDEGAFTNNNTMTEIWERSIKPTLLDYRGKALVLSNTNGADPENFFWKICNVPEMEFADFHAPTENNPYLPADEIVRLQQVTHPMVFAQEFRAEFVDWSGQAFFSLEKLLGEDGAPIDQPLRVDAVFVTVDSATKSGAEHDGTCAVFWGLIRIGSEARLVVLDWELVKIDGDLLDGWLSLIFRRAEELARDCGSRSGFVGVWIEDKNSGSVLIMQSKRRNLPVHAIPSAHTALGKDERAISVSGYVHQGKVKICKPAYDKTIVYNGASRNHLVSQITAFRIGDKEAAKRADDALDAWVYGVAIALGDKKGF